MSKNISTNATVAPTCKEFEFILNGVIISVLCVVGWVCNTLTIATLFKDSKKSVTSFLFVVLAVCDNGALALTFLIRSLPQWCVSYNTPPGFCWWYTYNIWPYVLMYLFVFNAAFLMGSVWITVLVTIHRAIAIKIPHKARSLSSIIRVRLQTVCLALLIFLFCLPRCFEIDVVPAFGENSTAVMPTYSNFFRSRPYQIWYKNVAVNILTNLVPLVILIILTYVLIQELHRALKNRQSLSQNSPETSGGKMGVQLTIMLVLVVVVFLLCQIPHTVYAVIRVVLSEDKKVSCTNFYYFMNVSDSLLTFNSAINFLLYCVAGKKFRSQLKELCCKFCLPGKKYSYPTETTALYHRQINSASMPKPSAV